MTKPRIIEMKLQYGIGGFDPFTNTITLDERLNEWPALKRKILKHELGHSKDKNILMCLVRDMRDYPWIWLDKECEEYRDKYQKTTFKKLILTMGMVGYMILNLVIVVPCSIIIYSSVRFFRMFRRAYNG